MKNIQISDELYDRLKNFIFDPFEDTPESVIEHLMDIVDKSKSKCSPWVAADDNGQHGEFQSTPSKPQGVQAGHGEIPL